MKTVKPHIICPLITLMVCVSMVSCTNFLDKGYKSALSLLNGGNGPSDQDTAPDKDSITINGYVLDFNSDSKVVIVSDNGEKYTSTCTVCSGEGMSVWSYAYRRVIVKAEIIDTSADADAGAMPIEITNIKIDTGDEDIVISGWMEDIKESSVIIAGDDGIKYRAQCPKEYIDMMRPNAFWKAIVKARTVNNPISSSDGVVPIVIIYIQMDKEASVAKTGTVRYIGIEGGFWAIIGDDGKNYDMNNLPEEFAVEGLRVQYTAKMSRKCAAYHMWGFCIELVDIGPLQACNESGPVH